MHRGEGQGREKEKVRKKKGNEKGLNDKNNDVLSLSQQNSQFSTFNLQFPSAICTN
jgi:hypothetical protein